MVEQGVRYRAYFAVSNAVRRIERGIEYRIFSTMRPLGDGRVRVKPSECACTTG